MLKKSPWSLGDFGGQEMDVISIECVISLVFVTINVKVHRFYYFAKEAKTSLNKSIIESKVTPSKKRNVPRVCKWFSKLRSPLNIFLQYTYKWRLQHEVDGEQPQF